MATLHHDLEADCPPERLWHLLADLESVARYNPTVRAARVVGARRRGVGAMRECDLLPKGKVTERVVAWKDGRAVGLEIVDSEWPVHFMRWVTRIDTRGTGVRLIQDLEYRVRFGPIGWLLDKFVMRRMINRNVGAALLGLIRNAETSG